MLNFFIFVKPNYSLYIIKLFMNVSGFIGVNYFSTRSILLDFSLFPNYYKKYYSFRMSLLLALN